MRRIAIVSLIGIATLVFYGVFLHLPLCVQSTANRFSLFSNIGICPEFVETSLDALNSQLLQMLDVGDGAQKIESALTSLDISYSWDRFQNRYQGIIRHPSSSFHAITIYVYVDEQRNFKAVEVNDSFTAI